MLRKSVTAAATGIVILLGTGIAQAVPVVVDSWSLTTSVADFSGENRSFNAITETTVQLPFSQTTTRSYKQSTSTSSYSFDVSASGAVFDFDFAHVRGGHGPTSQYPGAMAHSTGWVRFHVNQPVTYTFSGQYALSGSNGLWCDAFMVDSVQSYLFNSEQYSDTVPDESFILGEMGGADHNVLAGAPTGSLMPGETYSIGYDYSITATASDAGASAVGWLRFTVTPEASSSVLAFTVVVASSQIRTTRNRTSGARS